MTPEQEREALAICVDGRPHLPAHVHEAALEHAAGEYDELQRSTDHFEAE